MVNPELKKTSRAIGIEGFYTKTELNPCKTSYIVVAGNLHTNSAYLASQARVTRIQYHIQPEEKWKCIMAPNR